MKVSLLALLTFAFVSTDLFAFDPAKTFNATCKTCHTIGGGDRIGPDLKDVTNKVVKGLVTHNKMSEKDAKAHAEKWLIKFIQYPEGMIKGDADEEGYEKPDAYAKHLFAKYKSLMTEQDLEDDEVKKLIAWIEAQKEIIK